MSDKKKKETQQPQEEPQEKEDSSVEENQPQEDPVEEKLRQAEEQVLALNDKLLRTLAEYDNFRKRSVKEKDGIYQEAKAETAKKFLPVYDNLERALTASTKRRGTFPTASRSPTRSPTACLPCSAPIISGASPTSAASRSTRSATTP